MPDKLTDKEIVKALEICGTYKGKCTDCPAFVKVDRSNCKNVLLGAVEIINRQNADLIDKEKQLQDALKSMAVNKTKVIDCEKEINRLQAENERLNRELEANLILQTHKQENIDEYVNIKLKEFADKTYTEIHQALESNYKARTERIEKHNVGETDEFISYCQGKIDALRGIGDFCDNLLKELVGEDDG